MKLHFISYFLYGSCAINWKKATMLLTCCCLKWQTILRFVFHARNVLDNYFRSVYLIAYLITREHKTSHLYNWHRYTLHLIISTEWILFVFYLDFYSMADYILFYVLLSERGDWSKTCTVHIPSCSECDTGEPDLS